MNYLLIHYSYLQLLDLLTTVAFLSQGVKEANPLANAAMQLSSTPLGGLIVFKVIAIALGVLCWHMGKDRLLRRGNLLFACLIAWNLIAMIQLKVLI